MREEQRILAGEDLHTHTRQEATQQTETTAMIKQLTYGQETEIDKIQEEIRQ